MLCKACFRPSLSVFHPIWGGGGGGGGLPRGVGHNLLMPFSSLGSSKMEISKTNFFDILSIQNDQISHAKRVLAPPLSCGYHPICELGGGGRAPKWSGA